MKKIQLPLLLLICFAANGQYKTDPSRIVVGDLFDCYASIGTFVQKTWPQTGMVVTTVAEPKNEGYNLIDPRMPPPDKCANTKFIEAEKAAREKRDEAIKEATEKHDRKVTELETKKKNDVLKLNDELQKNLNPPVSEKPPAEGDEPPATQSEKIELTKKLIAGTTDEYEQKLKDEQLKEKKAKETAQNIYLKAVREARKLYSNAYTVKEDEYFSGTICNLHKPFELIVTQPALNIKVPYSFVPETDSTGKFTFQFKYSISTTKGGGRYAIRNEDSCNPVLVFLGELTTVAGAISHTAAGEIILKLAVTKACGN